MAAKSREVINYNLPIYIYLSICMYVCMHACMYVRNVM